MQQKKEEEEAAKEDDAPAEGEALVYSTDPTVEVEEMTNTDAE